MNQSPQAQKWQDESSAYQMWLQSLSVEDRGEADHLYQDGVEFETLQTMFKPITAEQ